MKNKTLLAVILVAFLAVAVWWLLRQALRHAEHLAILDRDEQTAVPSPLPRAMPPVIERVPSALPAPQINEAALPTLPKPELPLAREASAAIPTAELSERTAATELELVQTTVRDYRTAFGENPVGTNAEITRALLGSNPKKIQFPVPVGSKVNAQGELIDRWGTPLFFHQLSATRMDIFSAGPDRTLGTSDDLLQH